MDEELIAVKAYFEDMASCPFSWKDILGARSIRTEVSVFSSILFRCSWDIGGMKAVEVSLSYTQYEVGWGLFAEVS